MGLTLLLGFWLPVPYVVTEPGPVFDVLAEADGAPVVAIEGAPTYPTTGRLDLVTVSQTGGTSSLAMGSAILGWLLPNRTVEPKDVRYPPGLEPQQEAEIDAAVFEASASSALAATAGYLGRPVSSQVLVSSVEPGSPADGVLESGDIIAAVDGRSTTTSAEVVTLVSSRPAGTVIAVDYVRDGTPASADITSTTRPDGSEGAYLGLLLVDNYTSDFSAEVALDGIGGPSAGLVFSLAMVDEMTPGDLLQDAHAAATGTIDASGQVGPIGGVDKKMVSVQRAGAGLFLVPAANCPELSGKVPPELVVVPVQNLASAVDSINAWRAGEDVPRCS
jgi:PDZ domain-containing protein